MDVKSLIEGIEKLLSYMFGGNVPSWLLPTIAWSIAIGLVISGLGFVLRQIKKFWKEFVLPIFYKPEQKRQRLRRQRFADYIESEIRRLNTQEAWTDHRFAELEAEVETQGQIRWLGLFVLPEIFSTSRLLYRSKYRRMSQILIGATWACSIKLFTSCSTVARA